MEIVKHSVRNLIYYRYMTIVASSWLHRRMQYPRMTSYWYHCDVIKHSFPECMRRNLIFTPLSWPVTMWILVRLFGWSPLLLIDRFRTALVHSDYELMICGRIKYTHRRWKRQAREGRMFMWVWKRQYCSWSVYKKECCIKPYVNILMIRFTQIYTAL